MNQFCNNFKIKCCITLWYYLTGGPLAVTDANLMLGRLVPKYFPHIFGETEDQPLDMSATRLAFTQLTNEVINV